MVRGQICVTDTLRLRWAGPSSTDGLPELDIQALRCELYKAECLVLMGSVTSAWKLKKEPIKNGGLKNQEVVDRLSRGFQALVFYWFFLELYFGVQISASQLVLEMEPIRSCRISNSRNTSRELRLIHLEGCCSLACDLARKEPRLSRFFLVA